MKKKWIWLLVLAAVVAAVLLLRWCNSKDGVISHVRNNTDTLETYALNCMEQPENYVRYQSWKTQYESQREIVVFQVSYLGFGSQADEKGFYYAPDGQPRDMGCDLGQEPKDNGIVFLGEGDNYVYTEQIAPNWFWFERHW